jgi:hypothetical protein
LRRASIDRIGKGIHGAPHDALIADIRHLICAAQARYASRSRHDRRFHRAAPAIGLMLLTADNCPGSGSPSSRRFPFAVSSSACTARAAC